MSGAGPRGVPGGPGWRPLSLLFWSVIPAAFIGPGTVTTCALAGARFGTALLWALAFSTVATFVLQEAATRVTLASGRTLGAALRVRFRGPFSGPAVLTLVLGAIVLGCAAYQAGNVLGAVEGLRLLVPGVPRGAATLGIGAAAALLLATGRTTTVARVLAATVACMGGAFVVTAALLRPSPALLLRGLLLPILPDGAGVVVLGLVGTTVVPYNLFLGSALSRGRVLAEARFGIAAAVLTGGLISMGILVAGTAVSGAFAFDAIAAQLSSRLGGWAGPLFGLGLFAAGFSSAITAPFAAALTARGLAGDDTERWGPRGGRFRGVWGGVLLFGVACGLSGVTPIPAILLAQAFNGMLLPLVAVFLFLIVNDRGLVGDGGLNGAAANAVMAPVVMITLALGSWSVLRAAAAALGAGAPGDARLALASLGLALAAGIPVLLSALRRRRQS